MEGIPPPFRHRVFVDEYGMVPQVEVTTLEIVFLENHGHDSYFALEGIDLWSPNEEEIMFSQIESAKMLNCETDVAVDSLFRSINETSETVTWENEQVEGAYPTLHLTFEPPVFLGKIRFRNSYSNRLPLTAGVHKVALKINGVTVYNGRIKQGDGDAANRADSITTLVLGDLNRSLSLRRTSRFGY
jgi:hypothetical protein